MDEGKKEAGRLLANKAVLLVVSRALGIVFSMALFVLLSYYFSREEYGQFRQVWLINRALALEICTLGIPLSIFYFLPQLESGGRRAFVLQSTIILAFIGLLVTLGVFVFADWIARFFSSQGLGELLRIFCLFPVLTLPTLVAEGVLLTLNRTRSYAFFSIAERILMFVAALLAVIVFGSVQSVLLALIAFSVLRLVVCIWLVCGAVRYDKGWLMHVSLWRQMRFSFPLGVSAVVDILSVELDKLIITIYFSVAQFARYTNGAFDVPLVGTVAGALNSVMMPEFSRASREGRMDDVVTLWNGAVTRVALLFVPLMGFLFFFSEPFITMMFSDKYADSAIIFQIYLVAMVPKIVWYGPLLVALGHSKEPLIGSSIAVVANALLNLLFIKWIGFTGPAIATVLAAYVLNGYYILRLRTVLHLRLSEVFPWASVGAMVAICVGVGWILGLLANSLAMGDLPRLCFGAALFYAIVIPLLWRTKLLGPVEVNYVREYLVKIAQICWRWN